MHPAGYGALFEHPTPYRAYYSEEDELVYRDMELAKERDRWPTSYTERANPSQSTSSPNLKEDPEELEEESPEAMFVNRQRDPPSYEEALVSLGHTPTEEDLGPHSSASCSSSLVPYEVREDSSIEEDHEDQVRDAETIDTDSQSITKDPLKESMGVKAAPHEYQQAPLRYIHDSDEEEANEDASSDKDVEAPFLAPKDAPTARTLEDIKTAFHTIKRATSEARSLPASSGDESVSDLIDVDRETAVLPPLPPKRPLDQ